MNARKHFRTIGTLILVAGVLAALAPTLPLADAAPAQVEGANGTWAFETIQAVTSPMNMNSRSMALDVYGQPHLAFGGPHLYYAYRDGRQWHTEVVDPQDSVGRYTSLALDAAGHPYISYYDEANQDLKYAAYDGTNWHIERLDSAGSVGLFTSIALGIHGWPQVTYYDSTNLAVKIAWYDETGWHNAPLDGISGSGLSTALAMDASGYPHVAYAGSGVRYTYVDASNVWRYDVVDADAQVGGPVSLALDAAGRPHITYCQLYYWSDTCNTLRYAYYDGTTWQHEVVDSESWAGPGNSLAIDAAGRPHVSYQQGYSDPLRHAYRDGGSWRVEDVDTCGQYTSLALDPAGRPHVTYYFYDYNTGEASLKYAYLVPPTYADTAMQAVWQRTDQPVAGGYIARSWMWGNRPLTTGVFEPYADAPGGSRLVQYYDKARMEINNPNGDRSSQWFVTNGLLVREMVEGWIQLGDNSFETRTPAGETVAGDAVANNPNCPLYSSFTALTGWAPNRTGQQTTATLARDGTVGNDPSKAGYAGTQIAYYEPVTGHNVPAVLWTMMNQSGLIYVNGRYRQGLVVDWLFAMGYPISEPYWTRCTVAGVEQDVLVQLFERRVLTYTPANPAGWQVEMGNVGRHYYTWRYGVAPEP